MVEREEQVNIVQICGLGSDGLWAGDAVRRACRFTNNVGPAAGSLAAVLVQRASPTRTLSTTLQERRKHLPSLPGNRQLVAVGDGGVAHVAPIGEFSR